MSKVIDSPVKRFPGTVTLPDYLTFDQANEWEKAQGKAQALKDEPDATNAARIGAWMPGIMAVVEEWNLENFNKEKPPSTPRMAVIGLLSWLIESVTELYQDAEEVPNE